MNWVWGTIIGLILIILTIWIIIKVVKKIIKITFSILVIIILLSTVAYVIGDYSYNQLDNTWDDKVLAYQSDKIMFGYQSITKSNKERYINEKQVNNAISNNTNLVLTINKDFIIALNKSINFNNQVIFPNNIPLELEKQTETNRTIIMRELNQKIIKRTLLDKELVKNYDLTPDNAIEWIVPLTPEFVLNYIKSEEK